MRVLLFLPFDVVFYRLAKYSDAGREGSYDLRIVLLSLLQWRTKGRFNHYTIPHNFLYFQIDKNKFLSGIGVRVAHSEIGNRKYSYRTLTAPYAERHCKPVLFWLKNFMLFVLNIFFQFVLFYFFVVLFCSKFGLRSLAWDPQWLMFFFYFVVEYRRKRLPTESAKYWRSTKRMSVLWKNMSVWPAM